MLFRLFYMKKTFTKYTHCFFDRSIITYVKSLKCYYYLADLYWLISANKGLLQCSIGVKNYLDKA